MARELLGDRAYHSALRWLGIKNPGDVPVGVPVQLTAKVDDLTHLTEPVGYEQYGFGRLEPAVALEHSCVAIRAGGGGLWIFGGHCTTDVTIHRDDVLVLTGVTAIVPSPLGGISSAANLNATVQGFHMTPVNIGAPANPFVWDVTTAGSFWTFGKMYLGAGQRLLFCGNAVNSARTVRLLFLEVPSPAG